LERPKIDIPIPEELISISLGWATLPQPLEVSWIQQDKANISDMCSESRNQDILYGWGCARSSKHSRLNRWSISVWIISFEKYLKTK
jgi:hypothetical protein